MSFKTLWTISSLSKLPQPALSGLFESCPDSFITVRKILKLSRQCSKCLDIFKIVRTVLKGSGQFQKGPDGFDSVQTVWKLSERFWNYLDGVNAVCTLQEMFTHLLYVARDVYPFFDVSCKVDLRASSGKNLRVKSRYPDSFRFCTYGMEGNVPSSSPLDVWWIFFTSHFSMSASVLPAGGHWTPGGSKLLPSI